MNKRRTIYKGFNKRRKNKIIKVYIIGLGVFLSLICGYIQFKNSNIFNNIKEKIASIELNIPFTDFKKLDNSGLEIFKYEDISKEIEDVKNDSSELKDNEVSEDIKIAKVKSWNIYTIQVASVEDKNEIEKI